MGASHPGSDERNEREPEEEMQVGPQDTTAHARGDLQHMVMVVLIDALVAVVQAR